MRLEQMYRKDGNSQPQVSIELIPSRTEEGQNNIVQSVQSLAPFQPTMFTMTYGLIGRTTKLTLDCVGWLRRHLLTSDVMCHLNIAGQTKEELRQTLKWLEEMGVSNLIALRGDPLKGQTGFAPHPQGFQNTVEFVSEIVSNPCFSVAVAGYPEIHPDADGNRAADIGWLKRKVDAGGCVVFTQFFFDHASFWGFREEVEKAGIDAPVVPGILLLRSQNWLFERAGKYGVSVPKRVGERLQKLNQDPKGVIEYGIELASGLCQGLLEDGVPGLHFYCLNHGEGVAKVLSNLGFQKD